MILNVWYSEQIEKLLGPRERCAGEWNEETHTKELPSAQQTEDFVYDSAETFI